MPRSGHTLTQCRNSYFIFGGTINGLSDPNTKKIGPTNELWILDLLGKNQYSWRKENPKGDVPSPRSNHIAVAIKKIEAQENSTCIFIFGGMGEKGKLDDAYIYDPNENKFTRIQTEVTPSPRANHSAYVYEGKVYMFGGNGGRAYENSVFKDLWIFDYDKLMWEEVKYGYHPNLPEFRSGQTMFFHNKCLYLYGGWNTSTCYNNAIKYDFQKNEWSTTNINNDNFYVWNHCGLDVDAVPSWKYFVFGGCTPSSTFDELKPRERAKCVNKVYYCDLDHQILEEVKLEDSNTIPEPREDSTMVYYRPTKNLIVFGGWNNEWYNEIYGLCVSSIVGPSYSVRKVEPPMGRISGNQEIKIFGTKLSGGNINVYFISGNKFKFQTATSISETELSVLTPNFLDIGPKEVEVRIKIDNEELSTNLVPFNIYLDTKADKSVFFGPACIDGGMPGVPTSFIIRAKNELNENRTSGLDDIKVTIFSSTLEEVHDVTITDLNNGTYRVDLTVPQKDRYKISVMLREDNITHNLRDSPLNVMFDGEDPSANDMLGSVMINKFLKENVETLEKDMMKMIEESSTKGKDLKNINTIISIKFTNKEMQSVADKYDCKINQLIEYYRHFELDKKKLARDITYDRINNMFKTHEQMLKVMEESRQEITPIIQIKTEEYKELIKEFGREINNYGSKIRTRDFANKYENGPNRAYEEIDQVNNQINEYQKKLDEYDRIMKNLELPEETQMCFKALENIKNEMKVIKNMWTFIAETLQLFEEFKSTSWPDINGPAMDEKIGQGLSKRSNAIKKEASAFAVITDQMQREINLWKKLVPLIASMKNDYIKERHWDNVREVINYKDLKVDNNLKIKLFYDIKLHEKNEEISEVAERAANEDKMEKKLNEIKNNWVSFEYNEVPYARVEGVKTLELIEDHYAILEDNMQHIQTLSRNRFKAYFEKEIDQWKTDLNFIFDVHVTLTEVQGSWKFLESLFIGSDEIKKELPQDTERFEKIDKEVKEILRKGGQVKNILKFSTSKFENSTLLNWMKDILRRLGECEKSLNIFMESKRTVFPRFYFISSVDLLDILSNGNNPIMVNKHVSKVILAIDKLELVDNKGDRPSVKGMHTRTGIEYVPFYTDCKLLGKVETYLDLILNFMKKSLQSLCKQSLEDFVKLSQQDWIEKTPSQVCLLTDLIIFAAAVEESISLKQNNPNVFKELMKKQLDSLTLLIKTVMKPLSEQTMAKVMVLIKSETHSRDVIEEKLIGENVCRVDDFQWQCQLKAYWSKEKGDSHLNIADAEFWYGYEYLGNGDRLVVTPLTDRIYVTATQALHLKMGCAPAGPAGTGKTETTKDLSSALGKACYVFNCSDQMDYKGMGEIFRGLASSGSWGCFDEFNRLVPEVLSVCSMQFKCITDALRRKDKVFKMEGKTLDLDSTCGAFITMNPGYLGRSELPEGLKALFRPITVVVPDFGMISENCLMAQGFIEAKILAKKFVVLYALCQDLLSKQMHYDWGLRAIKSVLVVAGAFKRADPDMSELQLLKRALRDFNYPKIVKDDLPIFDGLIGDLFPNVEVERKRDLEFEKKIIDACSIVNETKKGKGMIDEDAVPAFKYFTDPNFVLKVVQLRELIEIRHSVFIMGNAGSGKSSTWKTLAKAFDLSNMKTETRDLNPKSISSDDLYGKYINIQTRDFKYGILSKIMKDMGTAQDKNQKWIILDGDLDANWIENMNSVMDDNKVLTLPNNDRIDLLPNMRLFFEIRDLKFATKATVSRAGILYISDEDGYQWKAFKESWIDQMRFRKRIENETRDYFTKFLEPCLNYLKSTKFIVAQVFQITFVISLCKLLEAYIEKREACISKDKKKPTKPDEEAYLGYDYIFCFCVIWACGAILTEKDGIEYRKNFSEWFKGQFKEFKFSTKSIFDYFVNIDQETKSVRFEEWTKKITEIEYKPGENIKYVTVPTTETFSVSEIMEQLLEVMHPTLLIGMAGCGKTQICKGMLETKRRKEELRNSSFTFVIVNFNNYTDTYMMQNVFFQNTEKSVGKTFVPKGSPKLMTIFIDDLNMQQLDKCLTQNAIELVRQFMDYKHIYDLTKLDTIDFMNIQFVAAMNPTAGSFNINPRLQRHFWICSVPFPQDASLTTVYSFFLNGHFKNFNASVLEISKTLIQASLKLHQRVCARFKKSAKNFHYEFNIRHITGVFQGVLMSTLEKYKDHEKIAKLWLHECERVYGDRLVSPQDLSIYKQEMLEIIKNTAMNKVTMLPKYLMDKGGETLIFCRFVNGHLSNEYDIAAKFQDVRDKATIALNEHNDNLFVMELVLFEDAVKHVCRISRIISQPSGHGLLVGVGGSGKQSLSRLSSFICQYDTKTITITQDYKLPQFKEDLQKMYNKTGLSEDAGLLFVFTEGQIVDEKFMVPINDLLSSGEIQDLFNNDDKEGLINKLRAQCKATTGKDGVGDVWNFFINRVKKNLHMSICFSPGDNLRNKARKFPAIVNTTVIDWFQPWPEEALLSVGKEKLMKELEELTEKDYFESVVKFMPYSFKIVGEKANLMYTIDRRFTYVTPKSFLELLKLFISMYKQKIEVIANNKNKLESGLRKLIDAKEKISALEAELEIKSVEIAKIKIVAEENDKVAREQAAIVGAEAEKASAEESIVTTMKAKIEEESEQCQRELDQFKPLMEETMVLAKSIKKKDLDDVKAMKPNPPAIVFEVIGAILVMIAGQLDHLLPIEIDARTRMPKKFENKDKLNLLADSNTLLKTLLEFADVIKEFKYKEKNFDNLIAKFGNFFKQEKYQENCDATKRVSACIEILYRWVYNMYQFYYAAKTVEPKQKLVDQKKIELAEAMEKLDKVKSEVAILNAQLAEVMEAKRKAESELNAAVTEENACKDKLELARRFTNALGSSSARWEINIKEFETQLNVIIGDVLIASAFVSYCGPFPKKYREHIKQSFVDYVLDKKIPLSPLAKDPLNILTDDAEKAKWNNQKLPADPVSIENAAILSNSERWSLMIDPQLQGIKWIREKEASNDLKVCRLNTKGLVTIIGDCIDQGKTVLIENLDEKIDATLSPVIARNTKKKNNGQKAYELGGSEYIIHKNFRFILHTKLSNPHYPPEIQAETTMINFTVTEDGLEDQLLALIVKMERPKLAKRKEEVIQEQNECKIKLRDLEDGILSDLNTPGDLLENRALIGRLENSKVLSEQVSVAMKEAKEAEVEINDSSNAYRPAAARGSLIFFLMTELYKLHSFYLYSLESYIFVIRRAVSDVASRWKAKLKPENPAVEENKAEEGEENKEGEQKEEEIEEEMPDNLRNQRVHDLTTAITEFSYLYVRRGMFERHKLIFSALISFRILLKDKLINERELQYLIEGKKEIITADDQQNIPKDLLKDYQLANVKGLAHLDVFSDLLDNIIGQSESTYWRKWLKEEKAESAEMPKSANSKTPFQKLLIIRALRPDRITAAVTIYIIEMMTEKYVEGTVSISDTFKETNNLTPIFFVLFPGVDPTKDVEDQGEKVGKTSVAGTFINIPMGQGQEEEANRALEDCAKTGKWIMLQNVHLMETWLKKFENDLERVSMNAHPEFRCFISAEPPPLPTMRIIPEPIMQSCIKVSNEAPQDLKANLRRAWLNFEQRLDSCAKKNEFKAISFGLCFFHSLIIGRKKFGSIGWSRIYNFNEGDLNICADVLKNYLDKYEKVPYEDLRYMYGEIMYGGHITDGWDRRTNNAYLKFLVKPELLTGSNLAPNFKSPDPTRFDWEAYRHHIEKLPIESPLLFGLHQNAEISYNTSQGEFLFDNVFQIQGGSSQSAAGGEDSGMKTIKDYSDQLKQKPTFKLNEIRSKTTKLGPYDVVALQECEKLNSIFFSLMKSLEELEKGLTGELNMTDAMEQLLISIRTGRLPVSWDEAAGYPSKKSIGFWFPDLLKRHDQMQEWTRELKLPKCVNISYLCNPMSFVTAVKQVTARAKNYSLDDLDIMTEVTNFTDDMIKDPPVSGVYVHGMFVQGAKWEDSNSDAPGFLTDMLPKELDPKLPVMNVFAIPAKEKNTVGYYECPVYYTTARGATYIFTAYLRMESEETDPIKWILAGVSLILSSDE